MKRSRRVALALAMAASLGGAGPALAAGVVQVDFTAPDRYADAGDFGRDRDANLQRLAEHLKRLGEQRLADGQTLRVEVLDVDLAGRTRHLGARGDVRLLKGGADWPRIRLRYALESPGAAVQRGEDDLADLDYLGHRAASSLDEPLPYEKAMLSDWFQRRFGAAPAH